MIHGPIDTTLHNTALFFDPALPALYAASPEHHAEATFHRRHRQAYRGKRMLDLGVGSGRTTRQYLPFVADYVGIDASQPMLATARAAFPDADFRLMDVREIARFGAGRFDFILGSWAILSAFTHEERLSILAAMHGLLPPGGMICFSAHNRAWRLAGRGPLNRGSWRPRNVLGAVHPLNWVNYLRLRHLRREERDYAIFNDGAHNWSGVFYYIDAEAQARQLAASGFRLLEIYGENGRVLHRGEDTAPDGLLHYVAVKA